VPAYLLSVVQITDRTPALAEYAQKTAALSARFGGEYVIRGKAADVLEGRAFETHVVVLIRFASREAALGFYRSAEYADVKKLREGTGVYDIGVFDGVG
jgi:uncharacterized protein (DUF1330 family)